MSIIEKIATPTGHTLYRVRTELKLGSLGGEYSTPLIARTAVEQAWAEHALATHRLASEVRLLVNALETADDTFISEDDLHALLKQRTFDLVNAIWTLGTEGTASDRDSVTLTLDAMVERADKAYRAAEEAPENTRPHALAAARGGEA